MLEEWQNGQQVPHPQASAGRTEDQLPFCHAGCDVSWTGSKGPPIPATGQRRQRTGGRLIATMPRVVENNN